MWLISLERLDAYPRDIPKFQLLPHESTALLRYIVGSTRQAAGPYKLS